MDGLPGVIASDDDFGVNADGIMVTETTITQFEGWDPAARPEFMRARKALQYSQSIDDFVRIMLDGNNGGYANDWLIGDNKTGEIALLELGLKNHAVKRTRDGCYFRRQLSRDRKILTREETKFDPAKKDSSPNARKSRWEELIAAHKGKIDLDLAKCVRDRRIRRICQDAWFERANVVRPGRDLAAGCSRVGLGPFYPGGTVQSKVIDGALAAKLAFWGQVGHAGSDFMVDPFLKEHKEYEWMRGLLKDMKCREWTQFRADAKEYALIRPLPQRRQRRVRRQPVVIMAKLP